MVLVTRSILEFLTAYQKAFTIRPGIGCIDYGTSKSGISVAGSLVSAPEAFKLVLTPPGIESSDRNDIFASELKKFELNHSLGGIVVGYPLDADGGEGEMCRKVQRFVRESLIPIGLTSPVLLWDERNTSVIARERLRMESARKALKGRSPSSLSEALRFRQRNAKSLAPEHLDKVDMNASVVILESVLTESRRIISELKKKSNVNV